MSQVTNSNKGFSGLFVSDPILDEIKVTVSHHENGTTRVYEGFLTGPMSFSSSADWAPGFLSDILSGANSALKTVNQIVGATNQATGGRANLDEYQVLGRTNIKIGNIGLYDNTWGGSSTYLPLSIAMEMVNIYEGDDVLNDAWNIMSLNHPRVRKEVLESPGGALKSVGSTDGLWTISIGKWFKATEFLLQDVAIQTSETLDKSFFDNGEVARPISVGLTMSFLSASTVTDKRFEGFYKPFRKV